MNELGQRLLLARKWRDVFASEGQLPIETLESVRVWLKDSEPDDLARLLRAAYGAGKVAGEGDR